MSSRRDFLKSVAPMAMLQLGRALPTLSSIRGNVPSNTAGYSPAEWRSHFPVLNQSVNGVPLAYLDTAATSQRPTAVVDAIVDFYRRDNANPGRTLHSLARRADQDYEGARAIVAKFINATDPLEIVFTRGTTEGVNLVATAWGSENLKQGDEVLLTISEHASSMLPWQLAAKRAGATVRYLDIDDEGNLRLDHLDQLLTSRTKIVAFMHVSNVLGKINPAKEICARAHRAGAMVMIDAAQSAPHFRIDVQELGCDFLAFSGHKMMGPMGIGVLWGRRELLDAMPPYQAGSNMAHEVGIESADYSAGALKFGAGTPNVSGPVGLAAAIRFIDSIGREQILAHEQELCRYTLEKFRSVPGLRVLGPQTPRDRIAVFSFVIDGIAPQQIVEAADAKGIALRAGDLASLPLLERLGVKRAARASMYLYTTTEEVDRLVSVLTNLPR
ncbi:MAG TPA: SufS family cysteine desulfurase [Gemmatimonadaceae bacterium]|nr:SufS family cysteine desulfurase [Gemmatimonadaceae bacterium]